MTNQLTDNFSYHKRDLPLPGIAFSSEEGKKIFTASLLDNHMNGYFQLAEQFTTQSDPAFCGLGSLTMALNALSIDPGRTWKGVWRWFDDHSFDCCSDLDDVKQKGLTLALVTCLSNCYGALGQVKYATSVTVEQFREDVISVTRDFTVDGVSTVMIVSYLRTVLNQTGSGHFSPIGGYNREADMVLILDVARFKYPPHWVPLTLLFDAMNTVDKDSGSSRGYVLVSNPPNRPRCCRCDCRNRKREDSETVCETTGSESKQNSLTDCPPPPHSSSL